LLQLQISNPNMVKGNKPQNEPSMSKMMSKVNNLMAESMAVPTVKAASRDPPPVSTSKSLWITRKVRIVKAIAPGAIVTVADVKAQTSTAPFKIRKLSAWVPARNAVEYKLGNGTWINDTSNEMVFVDASPIGRLNGCVFNIPDQLAEIMNTDTTPVISAVPLGTVDGLAGGVLVVDATVLYQI